MGGSPVQHGSDLGAARVVAALRERVTVLPFHRRWVRAVFEPDIEVGVLSCPRGSAKTWIAAQLAGLALRPGSPLWCSGLEVIAVSASLDQSRVLFRMVRESLADVEDDYRWLDASNRLGCTHPPTNTKLRVLSSSGKRAMGLEGFSLILADEPGSWEARGGALMWDALRQSLGKRAGQRLLLIGTRAPADPGTWWPDLIDGGSGPGVHVTSLAATDEEPWDSWTTIRRVNPMVQANPSLRRTILRERDSARRNPTMRPAFQAFRLNQQVQVGSAVLATVDEWERVEGRDVPPREGRPIVGVDLGGERSWSAAWALWANGRSECYALCPGIPDIDQRERQDAMPRGLYRRLHADGVLLVDEGVHMARASVLVDHLVGLGIVPEAMYCDRFIIGDLRDAVAGRWPIVIRQTRWSESTEDVAAFRQLVRDGPLAIRGQCSRLAKLALSQAVVRSDTSGGARLEKRKHGRSRDDVAVAAVLAAGALVRRRRRPQGPTWRSGGLVG